MVSRYLKEMPHRPPRPDAARKLIETYDLAVDRIGAGPTSWLTHPRPYPDLARYGFRWIKIHRYWFAYQPEPGRSSPTSSTKPVIFPTKYLATPPYGRGLASLSSAPLLRSMLRPEVWQKMRIPQVSACLPSRNNNRRAVFWAGRLVAGAAETLAADPAIGLPGWLGEMKRLVPNHAGGPVRRPKVSPGQREVEDQGC